jgi:hypothetical protein
MTNVAKNASLTAQPLAQPLAQPTTTQPPQPATAQTATAAQPTTATKGGNYEIDKHIWMAINPLFEYFRDVYDPVFTILDHSVQYITRLSVTSVKHNISPSIIPQLLKLLHISNNISEPGIYKITNTSKELVQFIELQQSYVLNYMEQTHDTTYREQINTLPKVTLSSYITKNVKSKGQKKNYMSQFFIVDSNLDIPYKKDFIKDHGTHESNTHTALKNFFKKNTLYMSYSSDSTPMNAYELDFEKVDSNDSKLSTKSLVNNYFSKNNYKLEDLLTPDKIYNQSVLALSVFVSFKEMMTL